MIPAEHSLFLSKTVASEALVGECVCVFEFVCAFRCKFDSLTYVVAVSIIIIIIITIVISLVCQFVGDLVKPCWPPDEKMRLAE